MDLSKIISIAGKSGLYKVVAQGRQALIAESLIDKKRIPVHSSVRVVSLDEVSMYTKGEDVPLSTVLTNLHAKEKGKLSVDPKGDPEALYDKLGEALPDYDRDRIYSSDVRKFFMWYELLASVGVLDQEEEDVEKDTEDKAEKTDKAAKAAPAKAKKAAPKKAAAPKPAGATKAKGQTTVRKGSQRGS